MTNDERILELKRQIAQKKEKLGKSLRFSSITNCIINLDGINQNINVLPKDQLISLLVRINAYLMSAKNLDLVDQFIISSYKAEEWIADIKAKIDIIERKQEEKKLAEMEEKLQKLLSNDKKVELELDAMELSLK